FTALPLLVFYPQFEFKTLLAPAAVIALIFCALLATGFAFFIQMKYQPQTTASQTALIFALEPFFASIFGYLLNGEPITAYTLLGGALIMSSLVLPQLLKLAKNVFLEKSC